MNDEELANAWESFATALRKVPEQRENRLRLNAARAADMERMARWQYEDMRHSQSAYVRGIRNGIFGFGLMI